MKSYTIWEIYDLSAIVTASETLWIGDEIGLSVRRHNSLGLRVADVPLWDCQSVHLRSKVAPHILWEEVRRLEEDVIGIAIKSPIMGELFNDYSSFFRRKAGYIREINPRILPVGGGLKDIWEKSLDKKARNAVRRAQRTVRVEEIDPADYVDEIYECNMSKKGVPRCYVDKECIKEEIGNYKKRFGPLFRCIGAFLGSKLVGYTYLVFVNKDLALFSRFFINYNYKNISIGEILLWSGIEVAVENGAKLLQYGSWSRHHPGLDMFLEHFGFKRGFKTLNIYVPLTLAGKVFLLDKKIFSRIANSNMLGVLSRNKLLRDRWYALKSLRRKLG